MISMSVPMGQPPPGIQSSSSSNPVDRVFGLEDSLPLHTSAESPKIWASAVEAELEGFDAMREA